MTNCAQGLVIKALGEAYSPGRRRWLKLRNRASLEAIVGAISGTLNHPDRLILGLPDADGSLVVAGTTGPLSTAQQRDVAGFLSLPAGDNHWPVDIPTGHLGGWGTKRRPTTRVEPTLVVEIDADAAYEYGHFRHVARLVRPRPDLTPAEITRL